MDLCLSCFNRRAYLMPTKLRVRLLPRLCQAKPCNFAVPLSSLHCVPPPILLLSPIVLPPILLLSPIVSSPILLLWSSSPYDILLLCIYMRHGPRVPIWTSRAASILPQHGLHFYFIIIIIILYSIYNIINIL